MRERGQVAVEAALTMPLMLVVLLVTLQLALLIHARLFTDYAAFQAARAGAVWGANGERMHDAALWAVLPAMADTSNPAALERALAFARAQDRTMSRRLQSTAPPAVPVAFARAELLGQVRVDLLEPKDDPALGTVWKVPGGGAWEELDFDGVETVPEDPALEARWMRQKQPQAIDPDEELLRSATLLTVRVRYMYELRIPFANWLLFRAWEAQRAGEALLGPVDRPRPVAGAPWELTSSQGLPLASAAELQVLRALAAGSGSLGGVGPARRFFIPLSATATVRMQSNVQRKWLMH